MAATCHAMALRHCDLTTGIGRGRSPGIIRLIEEVPSTRTLGTQSWGRKTRFPGIAPMVILPRGIAPSDSGEFVTKLPTIGAFFTHHWGIFTTSTGVGRDIRHSPWLKKNQWLQVFGTRMPMWKRIRHVPCTEAVTAFRGRFRWRRGYLVFAGTTNTWHYEHLIAGSKNGSR